MKEMPDLICGKAAVGGNYNSTRDTKGFARVCRGSDVSQAISNKRLTSFGLVSMLDYYTERCVTC